MSISLRKMENHRFSYHLFYYSDRSNHGNLERSLYKKISNNIYNDNFIIYQPINCSLTPTSLILTNPLDIS